ncbi:MAG: class-II fumarase/aspartase family protein [Desulfobulbia bacterium]
MNNSSQFDWKIYTDIYSSPLIRPIFSESGAVEKWIEVEKAVSRSQGRLGIIPDEASRVIDKSISADRIDLEQLKLDVAEVGRPVVGLVRQLSDQVGPPHNVWVHYGISTYDVMDTGTVLQVRDAFPLIDAQLVQLLEIWEELATEHRDTLMIGRTNGQHAQPTTFGLRISNWLEEFVRHRKRVGRSSHEACILQLGSMVGTLASVYPAGLQLRKEVANELDISAPVANWHNSRDGIAALILDMGLMCASLARIARDISSLSSTDFGEVRETGKQGRGRSSGMPHKRNPRASEFAEGVARLARQRAMGITEIMGQEHERSGGSYTAEWMLVPEVFLLTSAALAWQIDLFNRLEVNKRRMRENIDITRGMALSEKITLCLSAVMSKFKARSLVDQACAEAQNSNLPLTEVLSGLPEFVSSFKLLMGEKNSSLENRNIEKSIESFLDPSTYLGSAADIVDKAVQLSKSNRMDKSNE